MIPLSLLNRIVDFLVCLDLPEHNDLRFEHGEILWALRAKKDKLELRDAYSGIIASVGSDDRDLARIEYLRLKRQMESALERDREYDIPF
jgi:hypothetical protein